MQNITENKMVDLTLIKPKHAGGRPRKYSSPEEKRLAINKYNKERYHVKELYIKKGGVGRPKKTVHLTVEEKKAIKKRYNDKYRSNLTIEERRLQARTSMAKYRQKLKQKQ